MDYIDMVRLNQSYNLGDNGEIISGFLAEDTVRYTFLLEFLFKWSTSGQAGSFRRN